MEGQPALCGLPVKFVPSAADAPPQTFTLGDLLSLADQLNAATEREIRRRQNAAVNSLKTLDGEV